MELSAIIALLEQYRYFILFPLAAIEGPILGFVSGSLLALGYFNLLPLYLTLILADVLPDITYYFIGRFGKKKRLVERMGSKVGVTPERFEMLHMLWHTHTVKAMMITKFSYGLSTPLLIIAGLVHLPLRRFVILSTLIAALQYGVLVGLGYFLGDYFLQVKDTLTRVQLLVAAVVVVGVLYYFFTSFVRRKFWDTSA
jgi:membrane protein DedA with SNARE-associated domain